MPGISPVNISPMLRKGGQSWSSYWATRNITNLDILVTSSTTLTLSWTNGGSADYTGHKIYISSDDETYTLLDTIESVGTSYDATELTAATGYYFKVAPYKDSEIGNQSDAAECMTEPAFFRDANAIAIFKPTKSAAITEDENGIQSIWWDMIYGNATLGAEQNSGAIVKYAIYKITATEANFFYTGCQVGDTFVCETVKTCTANNKVQRYTGNHLGNGVSAKAPVNEIFNGSSQFIKSAPFTFNQPAMIYALVKQISWGNGPYILDGATNGYGVLRQISSTPEIGAYAGSSSSTSNDMPVGFWTLIRLLFNGASSKLIVDKFDAVTGDWGTRNPGGITLASRSDGGANWSNVAFKELIYRSAGDSDENELIAYDYFKKNHTTGRIELIVLAGQSNAYGCFDDGATLPAAYEGEQDNIFIRGDLSTSNYPVKMNPSLNAGKDYTNNDNTGWAAEQSASHELNNDTGNNVIIVKASQTGLAIADWEEGDTVYEYLEARLKEVLNWYDFEYRNYGTLSMLWMQGETDAENNNTQEVYEAAMRDLITRIRAIDSRLANLQIVMCKLPAVMIAYTADQKAEINNAFAAIAADTEGCVVLDTDAISGLAVNPADNKHYLPASHLLIGSAWRALMDTNNVV